MTDFLCDGLGFDKYEDLTTEYQVKGEFADYGCGSTNNSLRSLKSSAVRRSWEPGTCVGFHRMLDELWQEKAATSPRSLASIVLSESVVEAVRKEFRRQTSFNGEVDQLRDVLAGEVIRAELLGK